MKNCLVFLALVLVKPALAQLNDNFSDGDFSTNPVWTGSGFQINAGNQLQTILAGSNQWVTLVTPNSKVLNSVWEFYIQMNFDPSTSNRMRIYLISDSPDIKNGLVNGYFLNVGETGQTDSYDLYRQDGSTITKIIDGPAKTRISNTELLARVRITRDINGLWEVQTDITGGTNFVSEGTASDLKYTSTSWFGLKCEYTSSNSNKFYFDDFVIGNLVPDTEAPGLVSANGIAAHTLEVNFNEPVTTETALNPANYTLNNGYGNPSQVKTGSSLYQYLLEFAPELNTNNYTLTVNNLSDFNLNIQAVSNSADFYYIKPYQAQYNDVVINEIFADPSPQIELPAFEFIELWNTTEYPIALDQWTYSDATTVYTFGNQTLQPNEFVILCALAETANFTNLGKTIGISPWPSLNNSGDVLTLKNNQGTIISKVSFTDTWYKDAIKKQGGWSLELMNPKAACTGIQNWAASMHIDGGTPGKTNSIYQPDQPVGPLKLLSAAMLDSVSLSVHFNRYVDSASAAQANHYELNNGLGQPVSVIAIAPYFDQVLLKFDSPPALGKNYTLTANQLNDCSGVLLASPNNSIEFFLPEKIKKGDILINEVLFNPRLGGVDFVEIYNNSDHPLDLKDLRVASLSDKDSLINLKPISGMQQLIEPLNYAVLTTNPENIQKEYSVPHPNRLIKMSSMPALNDDAGAVVLVAYTLRIDQFNYHEKMHFPLIKNPEGVSLERSSLKNPANQPGNFRSAAASVGFATPGYVNSQLVQQNPSDDAISLNSPTFSPDNDGFEDALTINYHFAQAGMVANLNIYSDKGILVRRLLKNTTLASEGSIVWDGLNELNEKIPIGIYFIHLQVFDISGKVKTHIIPCVAAVKLN